jgi:hypothetical protein
LKASTIGKILLLCTGIGGIAYAIWKRKEIGEYFSKVIAGTPFSFLIPKKPGGSTTPGIFGTVNTLPRPPRPSNPFMAGGLTGIQQHLATAISSQKKKSSKPKSSKKRQPLMLSLTKSGGLGVWTARRR